MLLVAQDYASACSVGLVHTKHRNLSLVSQDAVLCFYLFTPMNCRHNTKHKTLMVPSGFPFVTPEVEKSNFYKDLERVMEWEESKKKV